MNEEVVRRDVEEPDEVLDSEEGDPTDFWVRRQRDLVTSVLDYNLATLSDLIESRGIDLSPRYQRRFRWDRGRQSKLIESFLMNVPVPPFFLNEDTYGQYSVIDGKQRLTAVFEFLRGRLRLADLTVFREINGATIDDLPLDLQNVIRLRANLRAVIILRQSDANVKYEVFKRLNTGGVRLNPQEIRNSSWPGPLNDLILELSEAPTFHKLLGIDRKERSAIYREMRDAEFVLRYFTFRDTWSTFSGGMMRHMDEFMSANQKIPAEDASAMKQEFLDTLRAVSSAFGEYAFRRWVPERNQWRRQVLASLFDAEMFACRGRLPNQFDDKQGDVIRELKVLLGDPSYRETIDAATNTPPYFRRRIDVMHRMLDGIVGTA